MLTDKSPGAKAVDVIGEVLPMLIEAARELYHDGNERDSKRITKAINELTKVREALE